MARYIQWDDVVKRYKTFGDIADDADAESVFIAPAEAYVDGLLARHYTIPFSSNNETVKDLCIDVAFAKTQMFKDSEKANAIFGHVNSVCHMLNTGIMTMVVGSGTSASRSIDDVWSESEGYTPVFGKGNVADFLVDSGQLYDEEVARE